VPRLEPQPPHAIDAFVEARLRREGLAAAPAAERGSLLRRVSLDLIGLPPEPAEVLAFARDARPDAYERAVDRHLASPRYGERWAAMWLDLARYADTKGYEKDERRSIWLYRDWVIDAFNRDLPFDRFTVEQLAGDLLPGAGEAQLVATAFHRNTMTNDEGGTDDEEFRQAAVKDRVDTTMQVWMGTTFGCAQCHDHKYDPFSTREYYALLAFFDNTEDDDHPSERPTLRVVPPDLGAARAAHADAARAVFAAAAPELDAARAALASVEAAACREAPSVPVMRERPVLRRRATRVHVRGDFRSLGEEVVPDVPAALHPWPPGAPRDRLGLALWLVARDNPLFARVAVNRFWEQLFGRGLVETSEDFGVQGEPPSHGDLLDWLASEFAGGGYSVKRLLRTIVTSAAYRRDCRAAAGARERDPHNVLLARAPRLRLPAEAVRDQALALSGLLAPRLGGPSVMPYQPPGLWQVIYSDDDWRTSAAPDCHRRSLYTFWRRTSPYPSLTAFDAPSREFCVVRRSRTNTPLQALVTLNDPVFVEAAQALGRRALAAADDDGGRVEAAFAACTARAPSANEREALTGLLARERAAAAADPAAAIALAGPAAAAAPERAAELAAWTAVANVLLNLDEVLTR
jgi:hypothetical protein